MPAAWDYDTTTQELRDALLRACDTAAAQNRAQNTKRGQGIGCVQIYEAFLRQRPATG